MRMCTATMEKAPPMKKISMTLAKLTLRNAFVSKKKMTKGKGTSRAPMNMMLGMVIGFPKRSSMRKSAAKEARSTRKTREYSHGCGHSRETCARAGVVEGVPQMKSSSVSPR